MKIVCPPGFRTDLAPVSAEPFWYYGQNVRFRAGVPETIGLYGNVLNAIGDPITVALGSDRVSIYSDELVVMFGFGNKVLAFQYPGGNSRELTFPAAGATGRWWFVSTEDEIILGRSNFTGTTYVINRADLFDLLADPVSVLAGAPAGGRAAGILAGCLIKAGTVGVAGGLKLIVRWSARRTDEPVSPPFGFERWAPDDQSAAGEYSLEHGSQVVGGGKTRFGFVFWTDTFMYQLTPRTDTYVFGLSEIEERGLLGSDVWCEAGGRVWWYDQTRTLNVYDGGHARQIPNPMRNATVEVIDSANLEGCYLSSDAEHGEIHLHYPGSDGFFHEIVYNYVENAWYPFILDRVAMTDAHGVRPSIGVTRAGGLNFYDLRETLPSLLLTPQGTMLVLPAISPPATPNIGPPQPFQFFLMTNLISGENASTSSMRARNVLLSHTYASAPDSGAGETINVMAQSYGKMDLGEVPITDSQELPLGQMLFPLRAGGKMLQYVIWGTGLTSMVRFGALDVEADEAGEK